MLGNPHAIGLVTKGVATVGTSILGLTTSGYLIRIGEFVYVPQEDTRRTTGPGRRGFREEEPEKHKLVKITIYAYGTKWETEHVVSKDLKLSVSDIEVVDNGEEIVEIKIRNLSNEKNIM